MKLIKTSIVLILTIFLMPMAMADGGKTCVVEEAGFSWKITHGNSHIQVLECGALAQKIIQMDTDKECSFNFSAIISELQSLPFTDCSGAESTQLATYMIAKQDAEIQRLKAALGTCHRSGSDSEIEKDTASTGTAPAY